MVVPRLRLVELAGVALDRRGLELAAVSQRDLLDDGLEDSVHGQRHEAEDVDAHALSGELARDRGDGLRRERHAHGRVVLAAAHAGALLDVELAQR